MGLISKNSAKKWGMFFAFLLACIFINFLIKGLSEMAMGGIVYLDCIGTIIAAIIGGYFPGATVALATNMLFFVKDESSIYFFIPYTLLALAASDFYKAYKNKKTSFTVLLIIFVIIISVCNSFFCLGAVYIQRVTNFDGHWLINSLVTFIQDKLKFSIYGASFCSFLIINVFDISICAGIAYLMIRMIPDNLKNTIQNIGWLQKPLTDDQIKKISAKSTRKMSVKGKMIIVLTFSCLATAFAITYISRMLFLSYMKSYVFYGGVDISMADLRQIETQFMIRLISLCIGFMLMIVCAGMWFAKYHIIYPVNALEKAAKRFDYSDADSRKKNVENIRELNIHTGDEIENLYFTLLQTLEETMVNYSTMSQNARDLDMVQSGLIMVLADMVENRDSSTGDHIRKTAAYTEIVMNKMRDMGFYTEELTDEFISNVVKSAPLHDIGKIHISDSILNKPGKLTDEEFEIMKTHTIYGAKVIDQCLTTLPRTHYLIEAKNIAKYHHEKWNGKGYPKGLSGEEIPLSARIMAVADVFDALVSSRVYKDAFPFEKAMDIIKKDSGSHFDPKVAEAFIAASDEVKTASEHFDKNKLNNYIEMSE